MAVQPPPGAVLSPDGRYVDGFTGLGEAEGLVLKPGETVFGQVTGAALVETRAQGGHWVSGSSGFSVPVGAEHERPVPPAPAV